MSDQLLQELETNLRPLTPMMLSRNRSSLTWATSSTKEKVCWSHPSTKRSLKTSQSQTLGTSPWTSCTFITWITATVPKRRPFLKIGRTYSLTFSLLMMPFLNSITCSRICGERHCFWTILRTRECPKSNLLDSCQIKLSTGRSMSSKESIWQTLSSRGSNSGSRAQRVKKFIWRVSRAKVIWKLTAAGTTRASTQEWAKKT